MGKLSIKQQKFADLHLLGTMSDAKAYIQAGYKVKSEKVAEANASRLISNAKVSAYIAEQKAKLSDNNLDLKQRILDKLSELAFDDKRDIIKINALDKLMKHLGMFEQAKDPNEETTPEKVAQIMMDTAKAMRESAYT